MDPSELLGFVLRVTGVMAIGIIASRLAERHSATLSHRMLASTALCILLFPLVSQLGPKWEWRSPGWMVHNEPALSSLPLPNASTSISLPEELREVLPQRANDATMHLEWDFVQLGVSFWAIGALFLFARLGRAIVRLRSMCMDSWGATEILENDLRTMAKQLGVSGRMQFRISKNEAMPMVCWFGSWVLVLPKQLELWSDELRQATLSHELGHIARRDVWVDYGMQFLCCLLWWHPMIWMMARDVTRLRELACDEWVLQSTKVSARSYANALLEVVRQCQSRELRLATQMATRDELEDRLRSITAPNRKSKIQPVWLALSALGIAVLAYGLSVVALVDETSQNPNPSELGIFGDDKFPIDRGGSTITGLVTYNGNPINGTKVKLTKLSDREPNHVHAIVTTDEKGRYSIPGMHHGDRYQIEVQPKGELKVRKWQYQFPYVASVDSAEPKKIELPDAPMVSNTQVLKGTVVDPAGAPITGLMVTANLASGETLSRTSSEDVPWTRTDRGGRFSLSGLPDEMIELMTYKHSTDGGRIMHPCRLKVGLNQQDIRIVYDPSLGSGIEDLDARRR